MTDPDRDRMVARLRALMAMTVANGCSSEEELTAARKLAALIAQIDTVPVSVAPSPAASAAGWAGRERNSAEYHAHLERTTLEDLLKAALLELARGHIDWLVPVRRAGSPAVPVHSVDAGELLRRYFRTTLAGAGQSRLAVAIIDGLLDDLRREGELPTRIDLPIDGRA